MKAFAAALLFLAMMPTNLHAESQLQKATFAGGCFWCMEAPFEKITGVKEVISGYTGGEKKDPTYDKVSSGETRHAEAIQITYDAHLVSYEDLLGVFWRNIDPTDGGGQFSDRGSQYRTVIFYHNDEQKRLAMASREKLEASGRFKDPIVTGIVKATAFYPAEDYHQNFYKKSPLRYKLYHSASGRDAYLKKAWGKPQTKTEKKYIKPSRKELKEKLNPLQYKVTQMDGTEPPFNNTYWDNKKEGIYVDIVSGEPLFSSKDKFVSGTGWPSFTKPLERENIVEKEDKSFFMIRNEVRSKHADSHLGHIFTDGPAPTGLRYCINSAALRFIAKEDLEKEGYDAYKDLF